MTQVRYLYKELPGPTNFQKAWQLDFEVALVIVGIEIKGSMID